MTADVSPTTIDLAQEPAFRIAQLDVRPATFEVIDGEAREVLEPRVMQVLVALARRRGEMVSRDELIQTCWGGRIVGEDAITRCLVRLRKLAQTSGAFEIETVPRVGVRLTERAAGKAGGRRRVWWLVVAALVVLAVVAAAGAVWWTGRGEPTEPGGRLRVAVEPVQVTGDDPQARALAATLAEEIESQVTASGVEAMDASSRDADYRLTSALTAEGAGHRITFRLTDGRSRVNVWQQTLVGPASKLRRSAAVAAAGAIQCAGRARAPGAGPIGEQALGQYLRACALADDPEAATEVFTLLEGVTLRAPQFAPGHAGLAAFAAIAAKDVDEPLKSQLKARGRAEAQAALRLNPADGTAYMALEMLVMPRTNWLERQRLLDKGLAADPRNFGLVTRQGIVFAGSGRLSEAEAFHRRAVTLNPSAAVSAAELAITLDARGSLQHARSAIENAYRNWPDNPQVQSVRFEIEALHGDRRRAIAMLKEDRFGGQIANTKERELMAQALEAQMSGSPQAIARAREAVRSHTPAELWPPLAVQILSTLGDVDGALRIAENAVATHSEYEPVYLFRASTRSLRADPRFMRLAHRWGLTDDWLNTDRWPEFCADPTLPYDCRTEAAKYEAAR